MTIVFLTRRFYPQIGGVETHILEISRKLIKTDHKVIVITEDYEYILPKTNNIDDIEIKRIWTGKNNWFKKFRIWKNLWQLRYMFKQADIIHCHDVFFWYLPFRFLYPQKKVFTTFHGYEGFPISNAAILIRKVSEKLSAGNICIGDFIKKWYGTESIFITYGGVNVGRSKNLELRIKNSKLKLKIILVGRLDKDIGVNIYLKSLSLLKKQKIRFDFAAIGEGSFEKQLKKYGKVIGFQKDITRYILNSDIIFCSSYLIMLQALIARKIVIAVYENKLKEDYLKMSPFVKFIYICKNEDEIVNVIESIKNSPWKSNSMIQKGYVWAREQTWKKVTNMYLELWKI